MNRSSQSCMAWRYGRTVHVGDLGRMYARLRLHVGVQGTAEPARRSKLPEARRHLSCPGVVAGQRSMPRQLGRYIVSLLDCNSPCSEVVWILFPNKLGMIFAKAIASVHPPSLNV